MPRRADIDRSTRSLQHDWPGRRGRAASRLRIALAAALAIAAVVTLTDSSVGGAATQTDPGTIVIKEEIDGATVAGETFPFVTEVNLLGTTGLPSAFFLGDGGTHTITNLLPGNYNVVQLERGTTGGFPSPRHLFALTGLTCDDTNSSGDVTIKTATFHVEAGETVTCTFRNTNLRTATIVIKEEIDGATVAGETFPFVSEVNLLGSTGSPSAFFLGNDGTHTMSNLLPGNYNVVQLERGATGGFPSPRHLFELTKLSCNDSNSSGDVTLKTATFRVEAGETVTCTFRNKNLRTGTIVIKQRLEASNSFVTFPFVAEVNLLGSTGLPSAFFLGDIGQHTIANLLPGNYNVVQLERSGWRLDAISCDDSNSTGDVTIKTTTFRVEAGETVTCTYTNSAAPPATGSGTGTVVIRVETDSSGGPGFQFLPVSGTDGRPSTASYALADGQSAQVTSLLPGTYSVTERDPRFDWKLASIDCDDGNSSWDIERRIAIFRVEGGETVTCTFHNEDLRTGHVVVRKETNATANESFVFLPFSGTDGRPSTASFLLGKDKTAEVTDLLPGTYSVTERDPRFEWKLASIECDDANSGWDVERRVAIFRVEAGETVTCTFHNDDLRTGRVVVRKFTDPPQVGAFHFLPFSGTDGRPSTASYSLSNGQSAEVANIVPGTYSVVERDPRFEWELASIDCDDGNSGGDLERRIGIFRVEPNETVTCTFLNERVGYGRIIVAKRTLPAGTARTFCFSSPYDGDGFCLGDGQSNDSGLLPPGDYSVSEVSTDGWDAAASCSDGSMATSIQLAAGETVTCTFTNTKRGAVTLRKTTNGVVDATKDIRFVLSGATLPTAGVSRSTFGDGDGVLEWPNVVPSQYRICEAPVPAGFTSFWKLDGAIVTPFNPDAGKTPPEDLGTRCYSFTIAPGQARAFDVENSHPGGDPRTIGYWKNWNRCTGGSQAATADRNGGASAGFFLVEDLLPQLVGDLSVTACQQAVKVLGKLDQAGRNKASDAAYELAAQLLASRFNLAAGAETCLDVQEAVLHGQTFLDGINFTGFGDYLGSKSKDVKRAEALSLATTLDRYNNGNLC